MEKQESTCYCGKPRNPEKVELQCGLCSGWFHERCASCYLGSCLPCMTSYAFVCKKCHPSGIESFMKKPATFTQICLTAVANLTILHPDKRLFSKDKDIVPFIDKHWESLTALPRRTKTAWHNTIMKTMSKESELFLHIEELASDPCYSLRNKDLSVIGPIYKDFKLSDMQAQPQQSRLSKRKAVSDKQAETTPVAGKTRNRDPLATSRFVPSGMPTDHPFNKDGYRYILVESDPHTPGRQAFEESMESQLNKPMMVPAQFYRLFICNHVMLAVQDRAPQLKISEDRLSVTGEKGYSMVRATHGVNRGGWYYEVTIDDMPAESATRIGWAQHLGNLQAPLGYDKFGYSWRSLKGSKFHESRGKHYAEGYKTGDTVGFYIYLPPPSEPDKLIPPSYKDRPLITFKGHLYFEDKDQVSSTVKNLKSSMGSRVIFYKNGESQGVAYSDVYQGWYYPAISLYKNASVSINFGPYFKHPPTDVPFEPMSEAVSASTVEHTLADVLYHVENEGKVAA
ncbi:set1/Ash2 histone methyltransferase complex subunit ASH2-like isoform X2 [Watersipora subatra]|uniref:set1/Ash2 histone methyltransferase complex subunit ASH2-like isoform X2 n=1 Tax=Watersipora subatra TaxID=2589382 RepID=UPI00355C86DB